MLNLENPMSVKYLQEQLKKELPRLGLNRDSEENLNGRLKTDPVVQNIYSSNLERGNRAC